jgi:hypothetical protein
MILFLWAVDAGHAAGNEVGQDFFIRYVSQIRSDSSEATHEVFINSCSVQVLDFQLTRHEWSEVWDGEVVCKVPRLVVSSSKRDSSLFSDGEM